MRALLADEDSECNDSVRLRREFLVASLASRIGLCLGAGDFNIGLLTSPCVSFILLDRRWTLTSGSGDLCLRRGLSLYTLDTFLGEVELAPLRIWTRNEPCELRSGKSGALMGEKEPSDASFVWRIHCFSTDKSSKLESKAFWKDSTLLNVTLT